MIEDSVCCRKYIFHVPWGHDAQFEVDQTPRNRGIGKVIFDCTTTLLGKQHHQDYSGVNQYKG